MKAILPYTVKSKLGDFVRKEQAKRILEGYERTLLADVEEDLAKHCNLTRDGILRIKRGLSVASLPVAMKIAEFFDVSISEIFVLKDKKSVGEMELV